MRTLPQTTHVLAERHEAVSLRLAALHKDIAALAAKKPDAPIGNTERVMAEGLLADCRSFLVRGKSALPVAAPLLAGLAVQLGQALAQLEDFENRHSYWSAETGQRCWRVAGDALPIGRLRQVSKSGQDGSEGSSKIRETFLRNLRMQQCFIFQEGFRKGQAARLGPPDPNADRIVLAEWDAENYPPEDEQD